MLVPNKLQYDLVRLTFFKSISCQLDYRASLKQITTRWRCWWPCQSTMRRLFMTQSFIVYWHLTYFAID